MITLQIFQAGFSSQLHPGMCGVCNSFFGREGKTTRKNIRENQRAIKCCPNCCTDGQADVQELWDSTSSELIKLIQGLCIWLRRGETLHSPEWELGVGNYLVFPLESPAWWRGSGIFHLFQLPRISQLLDISMLSWVLLASGTECSWWNDSHKHAHFYFYTTFPSLLTHQRGFVVF